MSRRSTTSATVVPTASNDCNEGIPDNHSEGVKAEQQTISDGEIAAVNNDPAPAQNVQATSDAEDSVEKAAIGGDTRGFQQQQQSPSPPKPITLPISQSLPTNVQLTHRGSFKRINNYKALAMSFRHLQPFARSPDGTYPATTTCVLCTASKPTSVFFPCQHMCVCNNCIDSNDMAPDRSMHLERCVCPVCSADIGIILPHTGNEEDAYWKWVFATKPRLPSQFTKEFKNSSRNLGIPPVQQDGSVPPRRSSDTNQATQNPPKRDLTRRLIRSNTWSSSRRKAVYEVDRSKNRVACLIL